MHLSGQYFYPVLFVDVTHFLYFIYKIFNPKKQNFHQIYKNFLTDMLAEYNELVRNELSYGVF